LLAGSFFQRVGVFYGELRLFDERFFYRLAAIRQLVGRGFEEEWFS
jgi:hypothetical protein